MNETPKTRKGETLIITLGWVVSILGNLASVIILISGMSSATGAPQEAVVVALALAASIIPYCFARALTELYRLD